MCCARLTTCSERSTSPGRDRVYDAFDHFLGPDLLALDDFFTTSIENPLSTVGIFEPLEAHETRLDAHRVAGGAWRWRYLRFNRVCAPTQF